MIAFKEYPPLRSGSHQNLLVRDVESHLSRSSYNYFKGSTITTTVHECTHGINADLRNKFFPGKRENCFYLLNSQYYHYSEPNWKKREVIPYIPDQFKSSSLYNIYVRGSNWDDRPLYLWDEWVAYVNGSKTGANYSITNAIVLGYYAGAVIKKEKTYALLSFFEYLVFELLNLANEEQTEKLLDLWRWIY